MKNMNTISITDPRVFKHITYHYLLLLQLEPRVRNPNEWTGSSTPDAIDILDHVVSNIQEALQLGTLVISITGNDILRPNKDTFIVADGITRPCEIGEVLRNGVCGKYISWASC